MGKSEESVLRWSPEAGGSLLVSANAVVATRGGRGVAALAFSAAAPAGR